MLLISSFPGAGSASNSGSAPGGGKEDKEKEAADDLEDTIRKAIQKVRSHSRVFIHYFSILNLT